MGNKRNPRNGDDSSSSYASSSDEMSRPTRSSHAQRNTRKKEDKVIKRMLKELKEDTSETRKQLKKLTGSHNEMRKQLKKLTESNNELRKQLDLHINGSSEDSAAPRSESNQVKPPIYRLEFQCEVNDEIEKGQIIETKNDGKTISVALCHGDNNQIVKTEPLASATVMLVVVNGEFNQHGNQYNWSREDFETNIKRPPGHKNQSAESIVKNCIFKLDGGVQKHSDATILCNSSNKRVRLGVMVLSPTEERVLEGLSNPFFVRGHDRAARQCNLRHNGSKRQKQALVGYGYQEPNGAMLNMQNPTCPNLTQPGEFRFNPIAAPQQLSGNTIMLSTEPSTGQEHASIPQDQLTNIAQATYSLPGFNPIAAPQQLSGNTIVLSTEPSTSQEQAWIPQDQFSHQTMYGTRMAQATYSLPGTQFNMDQIARPVQLVWDRPNVEPTKRWNLLDQLMPLYSCQPKFNNCGLPTIMTEHFGSLTIIPKEVMQTRRKRGVLIEPLEPDDSDEERPLKRKLHSKYRLRFVNKVCEAYYTEVRIKADDGNLLKVALFDENNTKITSGPLSSASVEVVVLHGDFNVDGQDYWTSEEFSRCVVCPRPGKEAPVLGGDRVLVLADGEACLGDAFFQITSARARTKKFKMGVMLASAQDERIQEGISEPFLVRHRPWEVLYGKDAPTHKGLPPGFRFHPTDEELIFHYLCYRASAAPCSVPMAEVDIYKFEPWDLPGRATFGEREWYFFCLPDRKYCTGIRSNRATASGYWKATGKDRPIKKTRCSAVEDEMLGFKKTLVFHTGRAPTGRRTDWIMQEYRLAENTYRSIINSTKGSSSTSSMRLDEWVLCKIYSTTKQLQLSPSMDDEGLGQPLQEFLSCTDLPPGFRFHPTDNELMFHYLRNRATSVPCPATIIAEVDIYKFKPWELPGRATFGDREWYFFCLPDRKYCTGIRSNRATASGYWKATGKDRPIKKTRCSAVEDEMLGFKKTLVFHTGRAPTGRRTDWIMQEYRLAENTYRSIINSTKGSSSTCSTSLHEWMLCKIYNKSFMDGDDGLRQPLHDDSVSVDDAVFTTSLYDRLLPRMPNTSITDDLMDHIDTTELFENLPEIKMAPPQLRLMTDTGFSSLFFVAGNEGSSMSKS